MNLSGNAAHACVVEWCRQAIKLYLDTLEIQHSGVLHTHVERENEERASRDAGKLADYGEIGVEVGGPFDDETVLRLQQGVFSISLPATFNEVAEDRAWKRRVGEAFKKKGLPFSEN